MAYLILTILQSTLIFVAFRLFSKYKIDNLQAITTNYIVATAFGFLIYSQPYSAAGIAGAPWFLSALFLGLLFILVFNVFALSSQKVGVALTSVASKMSVIIPVSFGFLLYHDQVNLLKISGLATALLAFYMTLKKPGREKVDKRHFLIPILLFLGNGTVDSVMKFAQHHYIREDLILFLSMVFLTAFVLGLIVLIIRAAQGKISFGARHILAGTILGLLNFGSTYYIILSMATFESAVVFPVVNAGIVSLSTITGFLAFREKLSWINWLGILLSLVAILLIAYA